jgi:hypothetical protein
MIYVRTLQIHVSGRKQRSAAASNDRKGEVNRCQCNRTLQDLITATMRHEAWSNEPTTNVGLLISSCARAGSLSKH